MLSSPSQEALAEAHTITIIWLDFNIALPVLPKVITTNSLRRGGGD